LKKLKNTTDKLRAKRFQKGYDFRSSELEMILDENSNLLSTSFSQETPSHSLIEDCMLLANKEAAKMFDKGVFRIHEAPNPSKLQILYQELAGIGIEVEIKDELKQTIEHIRNQAKDMGIESEVDTLIIQSQMQARYSPTNLGHFGLGFEKYTHFTSPIRRYSDLIVHRLLKAKDDKDEADYILRNIEALCIKISEKEREASAVEFEFMDRKFTRWADKNLNKEFEAKIISTTPLVKAKEKTLGATIHITNTEHISLFDDVIIKIEKADIPKAKIYARVIKKAEVDV
jgi:ribonuclease R